MHFMAFSIIFSSGAYEFCVLYSTEGRYRGKPGSKTSTLLEGLRETVWKRSVIHSLPQGRFQIGSKLPNEEKKPIRQEGLQTLNIYEPCNKIITSEEYSIGLKCWIFKNWNVACKAPPIIFFVFWRRYYYFNYHSAFCSLSN